MGKEKQKTNRVAAIGRIVISIVLLLIMLVIVGYFVKMAWNQITPTMDAATAIENDSQCSKYKITLKISINGSRKVIPAYKISWNSSEALRTWVCGSDYEFIYIPYHSIVFIKVYKSE